MLCSPEVLMSETALPQQALLPKSTGSLQCLAETSVIQHFLRQKVMIELKVFGIS